jgi:hypothetical protein
VKHVLAWVAWWLPLFWLWILLSGEWNRQEWVAAAAAATIAATLAEFARVRTGFAAHVPVGAAADVPQALAMVVVDFGIVVWALVSSALRRRVVRGEFVSRELEGRAHAARGVGPRAWTALAASYSPNAYVIDIEPETHRVLLHDLVPRRESERPA